jgi:hypothetical protein
LELEYEPQLQHSPSRLVLRSRCYRDGQLTVGRELNLAFVADWKLAVRDPSAAPLPEPVLPSRPFLIRSYNQPDKYLVPNRYLTNRQRATCDLLPLRTDRARADAAFQLVPGLSDPKLFSFESVAMPGYYLRHLNFRLRLEDDRELRKCRGRTGATRR